MNHDLLNKQINLSDVSKQTSNKISEILKLYNLKEKIISIEEINPKSKTSETLSNNFSFEETNTRNFKVELCNSSIYLVKKISSAMSLSELDNQSKIMEWCNSCGALVPKAYKNKNDHFVYGEESNDFWTIMDFIDGESFYGSDQQIYEASKSISFLLDCLENMPSDIAPYAIKKFYFTEEEHIIFDDLIKCKDEWHNLFSKMLYQKLFKNYDYILTQWEKLRDYDNFKNPNKNIIHNDLHPQNLIYCKKKIYIIDFESIIHGPIESCLGFSIIKLGKKIYNNDINLLQNNFKNLFMQSINVDVSLNDLEMFGKAEVFRKFLSMTNKVIKDIPFTSNGPEVHIDSLKVADLIFAND